MYRNYMVRKVIGALQVAENLLQSRGLHFEDILDLRVQKTALTSALNVLESTKAVPATTTFQEIVNSNVTNVYNIAKDYS